MMREGLRQDWLSDLVYYTQRSSLQARTHDFGIPKIFTHQKQCIFSHLIYCNCFFSVILLFI